MSFNQYVPGRLEPYMPLPNQAHDHVPHYLPSFHSPLMILRYTCSSVGRSMLTVVIPPPRRLTAAIMAATGGWLPSTRAARVEPFIEASITPGRLRQSPSTDGTSSPGRSLTPISTLVTPSSLLRSSTGIWITIFPLNMMATDVHRASASSIDWVVRKIVLPLSRISPDPFPGLSPDEGIEPRRRLVQEEDGLFYKECPCHLNPSYLASRKLIGPVVAQTLQAKPFDSLIRSSCSLLCAVSVKHEIKPDVLIHVEVKFDYVSLGDDGELPSHGKGIFPD